MTEARTANLTDSDRDAIKCLREYYRHNHSDGASDKSFMQWVGDGLKVLRADDMKRVKQVLENGDSSGRGSAVSKWFKFRKDKTMYQVASNQSVRTASAAATQRNPEAMSTARALVDQIDDIGQLRDLVCYLSFLQWRGGKCGEPTKRFRVMRGAWLYCRNWLKIKMPTGK